MRLQPFRDISPNDWLVKPSDCQARVPKAEPVRQWLLAELLSSYSYPRQWLADRARFIGVAEHAADDLAVFMLLTERGDPFLFGSIAPNDPRRAEEKLRDLLRASPFARLGVSTDGTLQGTRILRRRSTSDECDFVLDLEAFSPPELHCVVGPFRAPADACAFRELRPISDSLEDVFFEAHSHIRDIDGLHADESLDELCKILYAKLYDEEMTAPGAAYSLQRGICGTVEELAAITRRIYQDANEYDVRVFSLKIPGYDRSRGVFNTPIRLSSPAIAKVLQTIEPYCLGRSSIDVKGRAFQRVLGPAIRAGMGQYFTPLEVIQFMVDVVQPAVTDLILDPFSGAGHFLTQALDFVRMKSQKAAEKRVDEFAYNKLHGIEKSDRMVRIAMTDMRLHGDGHSNIRCTDALLDFKNYPDIHPASFDVVMTNPPFGSLLGPESIARLGRFELAQPRKNVPLEVLGLERCIEFLRPGGRLAIVLPDGILANRAADYVRRWLAERIKIRAIVSLPVETFSPFGANIKTSVLFAGKWTSHEPRTTAYDVHLARIDNVGYDATGRKQGESELATAAAAVKEFLRKEGW